MNQRPYNGLTVIQWLLLVAALGVVLTIAATLWSGPERSQTEADAQSTVAEPQ